MAEKYVVVSLDDEQSKHIADALGNKTAKQILKFLADREASESDIANELKLNLNTIEYNLNKLVKAGFIEKSKNFFWSKKGKKIDMYKLANKSILISTKSKLAKSIVPVAIISAVLAYVVSFFSRSYEVSRGAADFAAEKAAEGGVASIMTEAGEVATEAAGEITSSAGYFSALPIWVWFLLGAWVALVIFLIWNWRKL